MYCLLTTAFDFIFQTSNLLTDIKRASQTADKRAGSVSSKLFITVVKIFLFSSLAILEAYETNAVTVLKNDDLIKITSLFANFQNCLLLINFL